MNDSYRRDVKNADGHKMLTQMQAYINCTGYTSLAAQTLFLILGLGKKRSGLRD